MSLTSNSRRAGEKDLTTPKKFPTDTRTCEIEDSCESAMNHCATAVAALKTMQPSKANCTPSTQPYRFTSQPPAKGPSIIGTRRTSDCIPMPIVCWLAASDVATTENVAGSDKALHAKNRNAPNTSASQCCQTSTNT